MKRLYQAGVLALAAACALRAQGFEGMSMSYTSTPAASAAAAEEKLSLFLTIGAGFSLGGEYAGSSDQTVIRTAGTQLVETDDEYLNYGRGLKIDLGAAYRFAKHVDVRAAFNMSFGVPYTKIESETRNELTTPNSSETTIITHHHAQFGLKILLVPRFTAFDLIDVFIGAGIGLYGTTYSFEREYQNTATSVRYIEEVEFDTKASLPFIGMIGVEYPVMKRLVIYLDATFESMNVTIKEMKVSSTTFPAGDATPSVRYEQNATDRDAPPKIPSSNLAIRLGVRIPLL